MEDKKELYDKAKQSYYEGEPIMSDLEFDELESELGLENEGYIGTTSKNYTIKHPFMMGSIAKTQVKFEDDGVINFEKYIPEVEKYLKKSKHYKKENWYFEVSPKLDGCSFEVVVDFDGNLESCSTRGDGDYGKDIKIWFEKEWEQNYKGKFDVWKKSLDEDSLYFLKKFVIRGEVLVKKSIFQEKYSNDFTIPRSFVAGVINQDWEGTQKQIDMRNDLLFITYDYREVYDNGTVIEVDYTTDYPGQIIDKRQKFHNFETFPFENIYKYYESYRKTCDVELDGIVVKPGVEFRLQDLTRPRQEDCVAIKFTPEMVDAEIINIEWNVGKSGEYYPTGIVKEVILGGKKVNRVSLHNLDWITNNTCGICSKVQISLAGDIIPFVLKIVETSTICPTPIDSYIERDEKSGCLHLMKEMSDEERMFNKFITSVRVLNIDGIGEKVGEKLFNCIKQVPNLIEFMSDESLYLINKYFGDSKSTSNIINALKERRTKLTLPEIVESCAWENCGKKNSIWVAKYISGLNPDTFGIPQVVIDQVKEDFRVQVIKKYCQQFNVPYLKQEEKTEKIPIIMTGEPQTCSTKKEFLKLHPEYIETGSWKEVKIVFTNDLKSNTGKMKKARDKGIEIRLY